MGYTFITAYLQDCGTHLAGFASSLATLSLETRHVSESHMARNKGADVGVESNCWPVVRKQQRPSVLQLQRTESC